MPSGMGGANTRRLLSARCQGRAGADRLPGGVGMGLAANAHLLAELVHAFQ